MAITPYKMDNRLMVRRAKTIYEMKPDLLWDANTLGLVNGNLVSSWIDRRLGVTLAESTNDYKATYASHGLGNKPSLLFDGGDRLTVSSVPASLLAATKHTLYFVAQDLAGTGVRTLFCASDTSDSGNYFLWCGLSNSNYLYFRVRFGGLIYGSRSAVAVDTDPHTWVFTYLNDAWQIYQDSVELEMVATDGGSTGESFADVAGLDRMQVGVFGTSSNWVGWISQVAIWSAAI